MNLTTMRARFQRHTSDLASSLADSEVDEYLNAAYRDRLPAEIGGEFSRGSWNITMTAGTAFYEYPNYVLSVVPRGVHILRSVTDGNLSSIHFLDCETEPDVFNVVDRTFPAGSGLPDTVLFNKRIATFDPVPDKDYVANIQARVGPSSDLDTDGIEDTNHAMAVVTSAAIEYLMGIGNREAAADQADMYEMYVDLLQTKAYSTPAHRRAARSF